MYCGWVFHPFTYENQPTDWAKRNDLAASFTDIG